MATEADYQARINVSSDGANVNVEASGWLDFTNSAELKDILKSAGAEAESVCVDLRQAQFIDTAVLEYLARAGKALLGREKRLTTLVREGSHPQRVLRIASLGELIEVIATPAPAT